MWRGGTFSLLPSLQLHVIEHEPKQQRWNNDGSMPLDAREPSYRSTRQGEASYSRRPLDIKRGRLVPIHFCTMCLPIEFYKS